MSGFLTQKNDIKTEAIRLGFSHFGVAPAFPVEKYSSFQAWIAKGLNGDMDYLSRPDSLAKRGDPRLILENCQSVICLALPYFPPESPLDECQPGLGRISAYARTEDYHPIIWERLGRLETFIREMANEAVSLKSYVDTGPILERSFATQAGIGAAGKNTCLIIRGSGSYFFLAEILTNLPLPVDEPFIHDLCGSCTRCIEACPTACIRPDRTLDSSRCISALTIEKRGIISDEEKNLLGNWVFGCDACQIVCPHNAHKPEYPLSLGEAFVPEFLDLRGLFNLSHDDFQSRFGKTPLTRARREGILRNAAIVLGNQRQSNALPVLQKALDEETDSGLLDACRWAIQRITNTQASTHEREENQ